LEAAWRDEKGSIRYLYQGVLQVAVAYFHITRGNYEGAVRMRERSIKLLKDYPDICRGIQVEKLKNDLDAVIQEVKRLGVERINEFDQSLFKNIEWNEQRIWICDRCGTQMHEKNCKVTCPNCGNRFDCSDLNIYFD
jgi:predicted metal-dependent hydrolase